MARVQPYERGVNALFHTSLLLTKVIQSGSKIKEEPINTTSATTEDCTLGTNCYSLIDHNYHCREELSLPKNYTNNWYLSEDSELHINSVNKIVNIESKSMKSEEGIHNTLVQHKKQKCSKKISIMKQVSRKRKRHDTTSDCARKEDNNLKKKEQVECNICFRTFSSNKYYHFHKYYFSNTVCTFCKKQFETYAKLQSHIVNVHPEHICIYKYSYKCNICIMNFCSKLSLQSHLYHAHDNLEYFDTTAKHQTLESENVNTSKNIASKIKADEESCSNNIGKPNLYSEKINGPFTNSINKSSDDDVMNTETLNSENSLDELPPIKKLRQPTLTEYIELHKKQCDIEVNLGKLNNPSHDNKDKQSEKNPSPKLLEQHTDEHEFLPINSDNSSKQITHSVLEQTIEKEKCPPTKPFVRLHADFEMMQSFLDNLSDTNIGDKENRTDDNVSYNHEVPYSLRSLNTVPFIETSLPPRKRNNKNKKFRVNTEFSEKDIDVNCVNPKVDWEIIKSRFKCKNCIIPLIRCDKQPQNSYQNSTIGATKNTSLIAQCNSISFPEREECNEVILKNLEIVLERLTVPIGGMKTEPNLDTEEHNDFLCKICKMSFSSKEAKRVHIKFLHVAYMSSICNARYTLKQNLIQHFLKEHLVEQNQCCVCYTLLPNYEALKQHLTIHCLKYFKKENTKYPIDIELKCSLARTLYKCLYCNQMFSSQSILEEHRNYHVVKEEIKSGQENSTESLKQTETSEPLILTFKVEHEENVNESTVTCNERINQDLDKFLNNDSSEKEPDIYRNSLASNVSVKKKPAILRKPKKLKNLSENSNSTIRNENITVITNKQSDNPGIQIYPCNTCGKQFHTAKNLTTHIRAFSLTRDICPICGTGFSSKRFLQTHITAAHVPQFSSTYKIHCIFCNQGFLKKYDLRPHILHLHRQELLNTFSRTLNVNEEKPDYSSVVHTTMCTICNLVFETHDRFVEHRMYYYNNHTFTCKFCAKNFQGMYMFHHHNKLEHYSEEKRKSYSYICDICNEGFNHETHFHSHTMHVHSNEANLVEFAKEIEEGRSDHTSVIQETRNFTTSQQKQNKQSPYQYTCKICQLNCSDLNELISHRDFHSTDGMFICGRCGKRCKTPDLLNFHEQLTHSNRPMLTRYTCFICREVFTTVISLKCHEKHVHSNNSNTVNNWKKNYNQVTPSNMTNNTSVDGRPCESEKNNSCEANNYSCSFCDKTFHTTNSIQTHIVYTHLEEMDRMVANRNKSQSSTNNNKKQVVENNKVSSSESKPISCSSLLSELITTLTLTIPNGNSRTTTFKDTSTFFATSKVNTSILSSTESTMPKTIASNVQSKDNTPVQFSELAKYLQNNETPSKSQTNIKSKSNSISSSSGSSTVLDNSQSYKSVNITNMEPESMNSFFTCPFCPLEYPSLFYFHAHLEFSHSNSIYHRDTQNEPTSSRTLLNKNKTVIQCLLCPCNFNNEMRYKTHLRQIHTYCIYIPNGEQTLNSNKDNLSEKICEEKKKNELTTNSNKQNDISEVITLDDDDEDDNIHDNNSKIMKNTTSEPEATKVTPSSDQNQQNDKIGKLRVKSFAKIIENLSTDYVSNLI